MGLARVLDSPIALGFHRVLGPHRVLRLHRVLGPPWVLGAGSCQGPGSHFFGMTILFENYMTFYLFITKELIDHYNLANVRK